MPDAIRRLEQVERIEWAGDRPLDEIISAIFHQGDPNTGSYATVPHLVRIAQLRPPGERLPLLAACAWVEQYRTSTRPAIPNDLEPAYRSALVEARSMLIELLGAPRSSWGSPGDPYELREIFIAIAILLGERRLAFLIDHLDELEYRMKKDDPASWPPWPE
jgi:hypothetical protein